VGIQKGITLHRSIDEFTDAHPATKQAKEVFRPAYRLYSGAMVDVVYDHFLANDKSEFAPGSLSVFSNEVYKTIGQFERLLPERFQKMFPYMKTQNWLYNYHTQWGTIKSFEGVVRRSAYLTESTSAAQIFEINYPLLQECYSAFFPAVKDFAFTTLNQL
jgi:acyl carrier protein phosphodiesterase